MCACLQRELRGEATVCRILPQPSKVLAVSLPRPMGIVLEEDTRRGRVVVSELAERSEAAKRAKAGTSPQTGHVCSKDTL